MGLQQRKQYQLLSTSAYIGYKRGSTKIPTSSACVAPSQDGLRCTNGLTPNQNTLTLRYMWKGSSQRASRIARQQRLRIFTMCREQQNQTYFRLLLSLVSCLPTTFLSYEDRRILESEGRQCMHSRMIKDNESKWKIRLHFYLYIQIDCNLSIILPTDT